MQTKFLKDILILFIFISLLTACSKNNVQNSQARNVDLSIVSGKNQIGHAGEKLNNPVVVRATDKNGGPVEDVTLFFTIIEGDGTLNKASGITDEKGYEEVVWTIGDGLFHKMKITIVDDQYVGPAEFVDALTDRWVHVSIISGNNQKGIQREQLAEPIVVKILDQYEKPVKNLDVHFEIIAGGGSLNKTKARTDDEGLAELRSRLGSGAYQQIKVSVDDLYYVAKYAFIYAETEFVIVNNPEAKWISGIDFVTGNGSRIPHDNRILESAHFLVFSDASSDDVKQQYSNMAEESLSELLVAFDISGPEELGINSQDTQTKIRIYCSKDREVYMHAFAYGFILYDIDHQAWQSSWAPRRWLSYRNIVKHETMHVVQFLLGPGVDGEWGDAWFGEGIAEYVSGGSFYHVENISQVLAWRLDETHINPINIRTYWDEIPDGANAGKYYPMFGLAVEYLLDKKGQGKTLLDVKEMFIKTAEWNDFDLAFETYMGMSIAYYKAHFYDLVTEYFMRYKRFHLVSDISSSY